jgi:hypothetical protein
MSRLRTVFVEAKVVGTTLGLLDAPLLHLAVVYDQLPKLLDKTLRLVIQSLPPVSKVFHNNSAREHVYIHLGDSLQARSGRRGSSDAQ